MKATKALVGGLGGPAVRNAIFLLAVVAAGAAMLWLRGILTPLILALFLMVLIDGLAQLLEQRIPGFPRMAAMPVSVAISLAVFALTILFIADNGTSFVFQLMDSAPRLEATVTRLADTFSLQTPPKLNQLIDQLDPSSYLVTVASGVQNVLTDALFVLVYLGFLIASRHGFKRKIVTLFPSHEQRERAGHVFGRIRLGVERYVWVQTVTGLIIAAGAWALMAVVGLDNAAFWAFFIFITAYVPMIGAAAGILAPAFFALLQFSTFWQPITLLIGLETIFFVIGNVILPRMQGKSLNLDPVVVLLSLAFWGAIWGLPGAFLSSPLTVTAMVILAQFPSTRWIAVLLSDDGDPFEDIPPRSAQGAIKAAG